MTETARVIKFERGRPEMPSKNGYVMAWRDIKNQSWYGNPECLAVFMHIMLSATSKPRQYNRKGVDLMLKAGQFATSYEDIAEVFDLHKSKVRRFIDMFVKSGQLTKSAITQGRINKGLLLSFTNWNKWQKPLENTWIPAVIFGPAPPTVIPCVSPRRAGGRSWLYRAAPFGGWDLIHMVLRKQKPMKNTLISAVIHTGRKT